MLCKFHKPILLLSVSFYLINIHYFTLVKKKLLIVVFYNISTLYRF